LAIFGSKDNKVSLSIALTSDLLNKFDAGNLIKEITPIIGGKGGGGQKDMAFAGGNNKKEIPQAIKKLRELIS
jgi:alanyl-tRNA synthetase